MAERLLDADFLKRLEQLTLVSRRIFRGRLKGERRSARRGFSSEFADYRNYVEGDDLRFIDWNIYGRLDRLFLKLFLEEEDLHVHVLVDVSRSMDFGAPGKLGYARQVAAAVAYVALCNLDRVQVHAFGESLARSSGALRGQRSARRLFEFLESLAPAGRTSLAAACRALVQTRSFGRGVAVVISDFLDPDGYEEGLRLLIGHKLDVHAVQLLAPEELDPPLVGDLRLVDAEDGSVQEITVSQPLLAQYRATVEAFREGLREFCVRRGAGYAFGSTATPFDQLVLTYLRESGLLK